LVGDEPQHYKIASSLTLLAMTRKEALTAMTRKEALTAMIERKLCVIEHTNKHTPLAVQKLSA